MKKYTGGWIAEEVYCTYELLVLNITLAFLQRPAHLHCYSLLVCSCSPVRISPVAYILCCRRRASALALLERDHCLQTVYTHTHKHLVITTCISIMLQVNVGTIIYMRYS